MFKKKEEAPVQEGTEVQFQKNIKLLWIYTTLFCLFALALIAISAFVQGKIDKKAEYYQDQYETTKTSSQSTIKNIQDENKALKADLDNYKAKSELLESEATTTNGLILTASERIENTDYLVQALDLYVSGKRSDAREMLAKVDETKLSDDALEAYNTLNGKLN